MATAIEPTTAQIIPFPAGGIRRLRERAPRVEVQKQAEVVRHTDLAFGGSWYHEEAISGSDKPVKPHA
ncbi:hypothetical protein J2858_002973 [Neorhizobium galegae]|uniref:DUF2735 domain-containing protein n=1 Tax=Rhizobium/Agrobacterium group TaxID=227290 RepID=UPI001AE62256|nr:DUF2735 domain-containing protein [Neorhizobium galegae]MBP2550040.1 hypothetical protein [Neorhizobium galegae]